MHRFFNGGGDGFVKPIRQTVQHRIQSIDLLGQRFSLPAVRQRRAHGKSSFFDV